MSELAQSVARAVEAMGGGDEDMPTTTKKRTRAPRAKKEKAEPRKRKAKDPVLVVAASKAASKNGEPRDASAGLRKAPKLKALLLSAAISRKVVLLALTSVDQDGWGYAEKREAERLVLRLEARGD